MILPVNIRECAALTLHMSIMRQSFKNIAKSRYKTQKKDLLQSYDYVLQICRDALEQNLTHTQIHLNISDVEVLYEFLRSYTTKLEPLMGDLQASENDKEQIVILKRLCDELQILKLTA